VSTRRFYAYKAENCLTTAARTLDHGERSDLLNIATCCMKLPEYATKREGHDDRPE
jgi:hypothetical protein